MASLCGAQDRGELLVTVVMYPLFCEQLARLGQASLCGGQAGGEESFADSMHVEPRLCIGGGFLASAVVLSGGGKVGSAAPLAWLG